MGLQPPSGVRRGEAYGLGVRRGGATLIGRARQSPRPRCRARRSLAPEVSQGRVHPQRSSKAEPTHLGVGWCCSHTLDCSDESMLMVISSSSSCTIVLVPDSSPRAYEGVEYSVGGFFKWEDSKGLGLLLSPTTLPGDGDSLSLRSDPSGV